MPINDFNGMPLCWLHRMSILKKKAAEEETSHMANIIEPFDYMLPR
jgi:hypothetical protein